jgi:outer membrane protein
MEVAQHNMPAIKLFIICILLILATYSVADEDKYNTNDPWGIAMGFRSARIPYTSSADRVTDVIPLLYFDNKYVFLRGLTSGIKLYTKDKVQLNLIGRYRFFDIPAEYQNQIRGS